MIKKLLSVVLVTILIATAPTAAIASNGSDLKNKDITITKDDKNLKSVVKKISTYTLTFMSGDKIAYKKVKLDDAHKFSITAFTEYYASSKSVFTKNQLVMANYQIFGTKSDAKKANLEYVKKKGNNFYYNGGDFGVGLPKYKIDKVEKIANGNYKVRIINMLGSADPADKGKVDTCGYTSLIVKPSTKSKSGLIVKSVGYKALDWVK